MLSLNKSIKLSQNITLSFSAGCLSGRQSKQYFKIQTRQLHGRELMAKWIQGIQDNNQLSHFGKAKEGSPTIERERGNFRLLRRPSSFSKDKAQTARVCFILFKLKYVFLFVNYSVFSCCLSMHV